MTRDLWIWVEVSWSIYLTRPSRYSHPFSLLQVKVPVFQQGLLPHTQLQLLRGKDQVLLGMHIDHLLLWFCIWYWCRLFLVPKTSIYSRFCLEIKNYTNIQKQNQQRGMKLASKTLFKVVFKRSDLHNNPQHTQRTTTASHYPFTSSPASAMPQPAGHASPPHATWPCDVSACPEWSPCQRSISSP